MISEKAGKLTRVTITLAIAISLSLLFAFSQVSAHVMPNQKLTLVDSTAAIGGFVQVQMNAVHDLHIVVALKGVSPSTTYTVWLVNCAFAPPPPPTLAGGHPCFGGALNAIAPFGSSSPGCPVGGNDGPLATVTTNVAGNGNSGAIIIPLAALPPGVYVNHIDVGDLGALGGCHPGGGSPAGFFATATFSFTI